MSNVILYNFKHDRKEYCVTKEGLSRRDSPAIRIHERVKDSLDNECWRQIACTHPTSNATGDEMIHILLNELLIKMEK